MVIIENAIAIHIVIEYTKGITAKKLTTLFNILVDFTKKAINIAVV